MNHDDEPAPQEPSSLEEVSESEIASPPPMEADPLHTDEPAPRPPPPRPPVSREPRTLPIFLVVLLLFVVAGILVYFFGPGSQLRPFKSHLEEYAKTIGLKVVNGAPPAVVGKVIVIDADRGEIDPITFNLPEDLRPQKHEDVGSVVLHKRLPALEVGSYGGTGEQLALVQVWRLLFIDHANGTMYVWTDVNGPNPRAKVQSKEGNQTGPAPTAALIEAVSQLPRAPKK